MAEYMNKKEAQLGAKPTIYIIGNATHRKHSLYYVVTFFKKKTPSPNRGF